jgi:AbiV family abortive infection protein
MIACRKNARELLEDADILADHGRHARAYVLLHTACEELGKFSVLEIGARGLVHGRPPQWKRFWKRFRSHDSKSAQLQVQLLMLAASSLESEDLFSLSDALFDRGISIRNAALYVDQAADGTFRKPSDLGFEVPAPALRCLADHALRCAEERGSSAEEIEAHLRQEPSADLVLAAQTVMVSVLERARAAGVERSEVTELITRVFN